MSDKYPYPLTVVYDRYGGCYSGGRFTAWNCDADEVPWEIAYDDITCSNFWDCSDGGSWEYKIGKGETIDEAIQNLQEQL